MLKAPRPGYVKTRLALEVSAREAAQIYRQLVEHQIRQLPEGWPVEVHYTPADAKAEIENWLGNQHAYNPQSEGDLGARMSAAMRGVFWRGAGSVILLGGDCPGVTTMLLETVKQKLIENDVVIGPAQDGGYYLLGLSAPHPGFFKGIPWSTDQVFPQTLQRVRAFGLKIFCLDVLTDVDDLVSWRTERVRLSYPR